MSQQSSSGLLEAQLTRGGIDANKGDPSTNDIRGLYLKLFSGEMFRGFQRNAIARDLVTRRTLTNGKSLQFIYTGRTTAEYHTPGRSILGNSDNAPPVAEKTVTVDDLLISSAFLYNLDEVLSHYDMRAEISRKIGYALAQKYDRMIFRAITRGARSDHPIKQTGFIEPGGTQIRVGEEDKGSDAFDSDELVKAFYNAAAALDEKGVSEDGRVAVINPRQYYSLIQGASKYNTGAGLINRDVTGSSLQSGQGIIEIAGIKVYKSMNIPFFKRYGIAYGNDPDAADGTNVASPEKIGDFTSEAMEGAALDTSKGIHNEYGVATEFANSCGLIFQREAAACVEAIAPQVQVTSGDISTIYQGDVILGKLAMGADYLNPSACVELYAGTGTPPQQFA